MATCFQLIIMPRRSRNQRYLDSSDDPNEIRGVFYLDGAAEYRDAISWLIDNGINFHSESAENECLIVMKDDDAAAFKLKWA